MKVRATMEGLYPELTPIGEDYKRRRAGDVFTLYDREIKIIDPETRRPNGKTRIVSAEEQFSQRWMEPVDAATPEVLTSAPKALKRATDEIKASRRPE